MKITTVSSREFSQSVSKMKAAAKDGPVIITDRGKPAHVLLSIDEYEDLERNQRSIAEIMYMPGADEIEFDPPLFGSREWREAMDSLYCGDPQRPRF